MEEIILGNKTGAKDEPHMKLTVDARCMGRSERLYFDVYADNNEDVLKLLTQWMNGFGFSVKEG